MGRILDRRVSFGDDDAAEANSADEILDENSRPLEDMLT